MDKRVGAQVDVCYPALISGVNVWCELVAGYISFNDCYC